MIKIVVLQVRRLSQSCDVTQQKVFRITAHVRHGTRIVFDKPYGMLPLCVLKFVTPKIFPQFSNGGIEREQYYRNAQCSLEGRGVHRELLIS